LSVVKLDFSNKIYDECHDKLCLSKCFGIYFETRCKTELTSFMFSVLFLHTIQIRTKSGPVKQVKCDLVSRFITFVIYVQVPA
jgi:hypothetical protein